MSHYGNPNINTLTVDKLASEGMKFTHVQKGLKSITVFERNWILQINKYLEVLRNTIKQAIMAAYAAKSAH